MFNIDKDTLLYHNGTCLNEYHGLFDSLKYQIGRTSHNGFYECTRLYGFTKFIKSLVYKVSDSLGKETLRKNEF